MTFMKMNKTVHIKIQKYYQESPLTFRFKFSAIDKRNAKRKMQLKHTQNICVYSWEHGLKLLHRIFIFLLFFFSLMTEVSHSHGPPAIKATFQVPDTQYIRLPTYS